MSIYYPWMTLIGAAVFVITGCAGGREDGPPGAAPPSATTAVTPTPTPTPGMTVQQVASKVAGLRATNQKLLQDLAPCALATAGAHDDPLLQADALICSLVVGRVPYEGQFAVKTLTIANPPAEVAALLVATRKSASALGKVSSKECGKNPESFNCSVEAFKASEAADNFQLALAGWEPYL
jgi:hypothetical protein